mmetsp:Transcript_10456/g.20608  ORF Transcript_10456/g.20608 Transcript_10456/m.20608 type:complete len:812 (+) Transcript_10456:106-2541(+)
MSSSGGGGGSLRVSAPRKERLSASSIEKLHEIELSSETIKLSFEEGPLGLQILDVPRKGVLVWQLSGQATTVGGGALRVGARVEKVAGVGCVDKNIEDVFELVKSNPRPLEIEFRMPVRKLEKQSSAVNFTNNSSAEKLTDVELSEETVQLAFEEGPLGLQILDVPRKGVLVWQLTGQATTLGGGILRVGARVEKVAGVDCVNKNIEDIFELVKANPRPLEIEFRLPMSARKADTQVPPVSAMDSSNVNADVKSPVSAASPTSATPLNGKLPPGQTQVRLEPVDRQVSSRLRNFAEDSQQGQSAAETSSGKKSSFSSLRSSAAGRKKEDTVRVVFQNGPLGLQISDVGKRVLVTSFERNSDGSMGQAEKSGLVHFGYQVVKVGQSDCEGMSMHQIGMLVQKQKRPVAITFRKLYERRDTSEDPARARRRQSRIIKASALASKDGAPVERSESSGSNNNNIENGEDTARGTKMIPATTSGSSTDATSVSEPAAAALAAANGGSGHQSDAEQREPEVEANTDESEDLGHAETDDPAKVMTTCQCGNENLEENAMSNTDPMYFHFVMLCKSSQIQILLDYEATLSESTDPSKHPAFELSSLHLPTLYKRVNDEGVQFPNWPAWIRIQYLDAYINQTRAERAESDLGANQPLSPEQAAAVAEEVVADKRNVSMNKNVGSSRQLNGSSAEKPREHDEELVPPGKLCAYCKAKRALRQHADKLKDDMYIHFALLFKTVKIQAANSSRNQEGYLEYLSSVDVEDLYKWCQKDGISMHEWMHWIKKQCAISYEEYLYKIALSGDVEIDLRDMIKESVPA